MFLGCPYSFVSLSCCSLDCGYFWRLYGYLLFLRSDACWNQLWKLHCLCSFVSLMYLGWCFCEFVYEPGARFLLPLKSLWVYTRSLGFSVELLVLFIYGVNSHYYGSNMPFASGDLAFFRYILDIRDIFDVFSCIRYLLYRLVRPGYSDELFSWFWCQIWSFQFSFTPLMDYLYWCDFDLWVTMGIPFGVFFV